MCRGPEIVANTLSHSKLQIEQEIPAVALQAQVQLFPQDHYLTEGLKANGTISNQGTYCWLIQYLRGPHTCFHEVSALGMQHKHHT